MTYGILRTGEVFSTCCGIQVKPPCLTASWCGWQSTTNCRGHKKTPPFITTAVTSLRCSVHAQKCNVFLPSLSSVCVPCIKTPKWYLWLRYRKTFGNDAWKKRVAAMISRMRTACVRFGNTLIIIFPQMCQANQAGLNRDFLDLMNEHVYSEKNVLAWASAYKDSQSGYDRYQQLSAEWEDQSALKHTRSVQRLGHRE